MEPEEPQAAGVDAGCQYSEQPPLPGEAAEELKISVELEEPEPVDQDASEKPTSKASKKSKKAPKSQASSSKRAKKTKP